jgi:hypothetical protein
MHRERRRGRLERADRAERLPGFIAGKRRAGRRRWSVGQLGRRRASVPARPDLCVVDHRWRSIDDLSVRNPMPVMMEKLFDALRAANSPDDKARAAAVEMAEFKMDMQELKSTQRVLMTLVTFNLALTLAIVGKLFLGH